MKEIAESLNMAPIENITPLQVVPKTEPKDDLDEVRDNLRLVISVGNQALNDLANVPNNLGIGMDDFEATRAYDSMTKMMDSLVKANKELAEISKVKKRVTEDVGRPMMASTNDIMRLLSGEK